METLEDRRLLTQFVVSGTPNDDSIGFTSSGTGEDAELVATIRDRNTGEVVNVVATSLQSVTSIRVSGGAGDDSITSVSDLPWIDINEMGIQVPRVLSVPGTLVGGSGNDVLNGGKLNDTLMGGAGNDELGGGNGDDQLFGEGDDDILYGNEGNDELIGGSGNDFVDTGTGNNQVTGGSGNDIYHFEDNSVGINFTGGSGDDIVYGSRFSDVISLGPDNDQFYPCFACGIFAETPLGNDEVHGGPGIDRIRGGSGSNRFYGDGDTDVIEGGDGNDMLFGGDGGDELRGGKGNDTLRGEGNNDVLVGEGGNDTLVGGPGDDFYRIGRETEDADGRVDTLVEGADDGTDTLSFQRWFLYDAETTGVDVDLSPGGVLGLDGKIVEQSNYSATGNAGTFENVLTGEGNDRVAGNNLPNQIDAGEGDDQLWGFGSPDVLIGGLGQDTLQDIDASNLLVGDVLQLGENPNSRPPQAEINAGLQTLLSGMLNPTFTFGVIGVDSESSNDIFRLQSENGSIPGQSILIGGPGGDEFDGIQGGGNLIFGDGFRVPAGFSWNFGAALASTPDTLYQSALLLLNTPNLELIGEGDDQIVLSNSAAVPVGNTLVFAGGGDDFFVGSEASDVVLGMQGEDELTADIGTNIFDGGEQNDIYRLSKDNGLTSIYEPAESSTDDSVDTLDFSLFPEGPLGVGVDVNLEYTMPQTVGQDAQLKLADGQAIEKLLGSDFNDVLFGNGRNNVIEALMGNDIAFGEGNGPQGIDTLEGGEGKDILFGDGFALTAEQKNSLGTDLLSFFDGTARFNLLASLTPIAGGENILRGGDDDDLLIGGQEKDTIEAGDGNAIIFGDTFSTSVSVDVDLTDLWTDPKAIVEFLSSGVTLVGDGEESITGGTGSNIVLGGGGGDTITGGNDASKLDFLFGNDGEDTIRGRAGFNLIVGGEGGDELLEGGPDTDVILGDDFEFELGAFNFGGLTSFVPGAAASGVTKLANTLDFTGPQDQESFFGLKLTGAGQDTIRTGDGFNLVAGGGEMDTITGGAGLVDVLYGNDGDDTISGDAGVDFIVGGSGADTIYGGTVTAKDQSSNFLFGDSVDVDVDFDLTGLLNGSFTLPEVNVTLYHQGNDFLYGGDAFDLLVGGNGDDLIEGGNGTNIAFGDDFGIVQQVASVFDFFASLVNPFRSAVAETAKALIDTAITELTDFFQGVEGVPLGNKDIYLGGEGNDFAFGGDGDDTLRGSPAFSSSTAFDFLYGGAGKNTITLGFKGVNAEDANDLQPGMAGEAIGYANVAWGGSEDDIIFGGDSADLLGSTQGYDTVVGGDGNDAIFGGDGGGILLGQQGDDYFIGDSGPFLIGGGAGDDQVFTGPDDDIVFGGPGVNTIDAGTGTNTIFDTRLAGDFDNDADVDGNDFLIWQRNAGLSVGATIDQGDIDANGAVDGVDLFLWSNLYGASVPPAPASTATANEESSSLLIDAAMAWDIAQEEARTSEPAATEVSILQTEIALSETSDSWLPSLSDFVEDELSVYGESVESTEDDAPWLAEELLELAFE